MVHADLKLDTHFSTSLGAHVALECGDNPGNKTIMDVKCTQKGWLQKNGKPLETCTTLKCSSEHPCKDPRLPVCDAISNLCVECKTKNDCSDGNICHNKKCKPSCQTSTEYNFCQQCFYTSHIVKHLC